MRSSDNYDDVNLKILCQEAAELEWINRALSKQINNNANRLAEIDKILAKKVDEEIIDKRTKGSENHAEWNLEQQRGDWVDA